MSTTTRFIITEIVFTHLVLGAASNTTDVVDTDEDAYELLDEAQFTLQTAGFHTTRGPGNVVGLHEDGTLKIIRVVELTTETLTASSVDCGVQVQ